MNWTECSWIHTSAVDIYTRRREVVKDEKDEEDDGARLDIAGALGLRHPGGLHSAEDAWFPLFAVVAIWLLVRVAGDVLGRQ